jgi:hypothetical protein
MLSEATGHVLTVCLCYGQKGVVPVSGVYNSAVNDAVVGRQEIV